MKEIEIPYKFEPRPYQKVVFNARDQGFSRFVEVWCRRTGKDKTFVNFTSREMMRRVGTYFYVYPTYAQGRKAVWQGMDKDGFKFIDHFPAELIAKKNDTDMRIEYKNGSSFQLVGSDNIDALMSSNPVGVVFSEYSLQNPMVWSYIRPILRENKGWAAFVYTPRGKNHGWDILEVAKRNPDRWHLSIVTCEDAKDENGDRFITAEDIEQERKEGMGEDMIQQEYYVSFDVALAGAYFSEEIKLAEQRNQIGIERWEELLPVETYWDLGISGQDTCAIVFYQREGNRHRIIDYYQNSTKGFDHYAEVLKNKPYKYACHYVPHDARSKERSTGREQYKTLAALLREPVEVLPRPRTIQDKIDAIRWLLKKLYVDKGNCQQLVNAVKSYQREFDEEKKIFNNIPLHNWASHPVDALSYLALKLKSEIPETSFSGGQNQNEDYDDSSGLRT
jgi:hypothetical protein